MWFPQFALPDAPARVEPTSLLLVQGLHELLSATTPDSFCARTLDLALLLRDFLHVAEVSDGDSRWVQHWTPLSDELATVIDAEQRAIGPKSELRLAIDDVIGAARSGKDPYVLRQRIAVAMGHLGDPRKRWVHDLQELLQHHANNKQAWLSRLSSIASHIEYQGLSSECVAAANEDKITQPPEKALLHILAPLLAEKRTFTLALAIDGPGTDAQAITDGSIFLNAIKQESLKASETTQRWVESHHDDFIVTCSVEAHSARSAAEFANSGLAAILNLHNLYLNDVRYRARSEILYWTEQSTPQTLTMTPSVHFGLFPRKHARSLTKQRVAKLKGRLDGRLANALECHALALAAKDPQTVVINLWTALETLSGSPTSGSIGHHVAKMLAPNIAWRRADKIVTYLAINFVALCRREEKRANDGPLRFADNPHWVSPDDVLEAITGPKDNPKILHFLKESAESPLLVQRFYGAWKEFNDPNELRKSIEQSKQRVEWQILRIYRARNLLVHRGEQNHLIWRLLKNAQYYVSVSLSRVLQDMSGFPDWGVDASLQNQSLHYRHIIAGLSGRRPSGLTHSDFLGGRSEEEDLRLWT